MALDDPVVITCAISGTIANREQCPAIPYTPEEYAAEARRIVDEGGVHIHIHARTPDGTPSYEIEDFVAIKDAIRGEVGDAAIINFSTGTVGVPVAKRIAYLEACRPEVAALNMGSMNYAKYSRQRKDFVFKFVFANPFDEIIELLEAMRRLGHQARARVLRPRPRRLARAAGRHGPARGAAARRLRDGRRRRRARQRAQPRRDGRQHARKAGHHWGVIGIGREQWMLVAAALTLGGSVRVGLEDNFYLPDGEMARSNGELIAKARQMTEDVGRRPATVEEARELLGIKPAAASAARERSCRSTGAEGPRPQPPAPGRLLLAAAGRLRRRRDQGRGHRDGRLRPLGAAVLRGRRAETARSAMFLALNRGKRSIRIDLKNDRGQGGAAAAGPRRRRAARVLPPRRARPPRRRLRAAARAEPAARLLRDHRLRAGRPELATAPDTT